MVKELGILAGGIFLGAVVAEIVRRSCPEGLDNLYAKVGELTDAARDAFMEGYESSLGGPDPEASGIRTT